MARNPFGPPPWQSTIRHMKEAGQRTLTFAELLDSVGSSWRGHLQVHLAGGDAVLLPLGHSLDRGTSLWIRQTKSCYSFEMQHKESLYHSTVVKRSRSQVETAPATLDSLLTTLLTRAGVVSEPEGETSWPERVERLRHSARLELATAQLLDQVASRWFDATLLLSDGQTVAILRLGDTMSDGVGVWIEPMGRDWRVSLRRRDQTGESVIEEELTPYAAAATVLDQFLETLAGLTPSAAESAQAVFARLLKEHIAPQLRRDGYRGSNGRYRKADRQWEISLELQRSRYSTRDRVDYRVNVHVVHPQTATLFNDANRTARAEGRDVEQPSAGDWRSELHYLAGLKGGWFALRPTDDLASHAAQLMGQIRQFIYPVVEEQVRLPLPAPTPLSERRMVDQQTINEEALGWHLGILRTLGVDITTCEPYLGHGEADPPLAQ